MTIDVVQELLLWSTVINMGIFMWWFGWFVFGHEFVYRMHTKWFLLSRERFDVIHYGAMAGYKMLILVFNLVPLIAVSIVF